MYCLKHQVRKICLVCHEEQKVQKRERPKTIKRKLTKKKPHSQALYWKSFSEEDQQHLLENLDDMRALTITLVGLGYSYARIKDELGVSLSTVGLWVRRMRQEGIEKLLHSTRKARTQKSCREAARRLKQEVQDRVAQR